MKELNVTILFVFFAFVSYAQEYKIDFTASGATTMLDSVHVLNLAQQTAITLWGADTLHLYKSGTRTGELRKENNSIAFYPNPLKGGRGTLSFHLNNAAETKIEIFDIKGKSLLSEQLYLQDGHNKFFIRGIPSGFFIATVNNPSFSAAIKLISIGGKSGEPELIFMDNNHGSDSKGTIQSNAAAKKLVGMQYNDGEPLKLTAHADSLTTRDTIIPTQTQTVDFYFSFDMPPVADFKASDTVITLGDTVFFTDQSVNMPDTWLWEFGDGDTSHVQHPAHVYDAVDTFAVSLISSNFAGSDTMTRSDYIVVVAPPVADFTSSVTLISLGDTVYFTDQSANIPVTWLWDFGDGDTSTVQHPAHVYDSAGIFTVSLIATNYAGSDTKIRPDYIGVTDTTSANYPSGTVHCIPGGATVVDVINTTTGETWMDRNLGASQQSTGIADTLAYGDLYQWGRFSDGHQCRNSGLDSNQSTSDTPGHGNFITGGTTDWRSTSNDSLWQGVNGINNPCPDGYRLPTEDEWYSERMSWSSYNFVGAYTSPLKLLTAGGRDQNTGALMAVGSDGVYWSSTVEVSASKYLTFSCCYAFTFTNYRNYGASVRCIKD